MGSVRFTSTHIDALKNIFLFSGFSGINMRITGGTLRSRKLLSIKSDKLRPATDRLRESMFDILSNIIEFDGARALDLYAGTGSVGFETLSRGAGRAVFVEANPKVAGVLRENAKSLGVEDKCIIHVMKVEKYLAAYSNGTITDDGKFDVVYIDPPYAYNHETHNIVDKVLTQNMVDRSGIICVEHSKEYSPPASHLFRQKLFGSTILSFIKPI
jgi:16S rRNA (guanine966-N2)-methyltransferase